MSEFQAFCGLQSPQRGNYIVIFKTIYIYFIYFFILFFNLFFNAYPFFSPFARKFLVGHH
jgi:TRAP-type mannitol/chloroaromatic compound transport system permease large subunit